MTKIMQLLYSAPAPYVRMHLMPHVTILNSHFWGGAKLRLQCSLLILQSMKKKEQRQVNKKFCELKGGNIEIVEKAQETRLVCIADTLG